MTVRLEEGLVFPRAAVRFPIELRQPSAMKADDPSTWPRVDGRLELVEGRLLYMPPCADFQQDVAVDVVFILRSWSETQAGFVVGANEAGMLLGGEVRGADAAVWRAEDASERTGRLRRTPPLLAVEIAGEDEGESELRAKADWYLGHGVASVWIVLPRSLEVIVMGKTSEQRHGLGDQLAAHPALPGLVPNVARFFAQIAGAKT